MLESLLKGYCPRNINYFKTLRRYNYSRKLLLYPLISFVNGKKNSKMCLKNYFSIFKIKTWLKGFCQRKINYFLSSRRDKIPLYSLISVVNVYPLISLPLYTLYPLIYLLYLLWIENKTYKKCLKNYFLTLCLSNKNIIINWKYS